MKDPLSSLDVLTDGHVHTRLCHHASGEMEEYVQSAIDKGLRKIVFLEHLETGVDYSQSTWLSDEDFDYYFEEGARLRRKYQGAISIETGVELGYNPEHGAEILARVGERSWDRVGISCHFLRFTGTTGHLNLLSRKRENMDAARRIGCERILTAYFTALFDAVQLLPGNVLCHLDAALRYIPELTLTADHWQQIDRLLAAVKAKGMALEINTSGIVIRGEPFPAKPILAMAIGYDIPLVAGSDAHRPADVGNHFTALPAYITSAACS